MRVMCAEIEALFDASILPIPSTHDETAALDYYRSSLDGIDLNVNLYTPTASTYPI